LIISFTSSEYKSISKPDITLLRNFNVNMIEEIRMCPEKIENTGRASKRSNEELQIDTYKNKL
jgi:hypothetical protein